MASDTYTRILDTAQSLIINRGYNAFSYADISAVLGIGKATIHHHFPGKADLVVAVIARYRQATEDGLGAMAAHEPRAGRRLAGYVGFWEQCIRDSNAPFCIAALLAAELPSLPAEVAEQVKAHFDELTARLTSFIDEGLRKGELTSTEDAERSARILVATVHGAMLAARVAGGDAELYASITAPALQRLTRQIAST
ncbi:TetR/AcrR family transcriptional regulator [Rhizobium sp. Rhizsp42]|uniref:TetR/AcrR family transcriptional regulator n=1 Tax=Rhizobium sp. Rhizsp42 TaxID=3243034 RepID=UPI0039B0209B